MRHLKVGKKFNRTSSHRDAMFRNMTISLLKHEIIKTTLIKAKELRKFIEPLISLSKKSHLDIKKQQCNRKVIFNRLRNKNAVKKLFEDIAPRFKNRNGGYTRILKYGYRLGDSAKMAFIEFTDKAINNTTIIKK